MPIAAPMTKTLRLAAALAAALTALTTLTTVTMTAGCRTKAQPPDANDFIAAMNTYLQKRGDLCISRADWPVDVTVEEASAGTRDAVQMPVLERLNLVQSSTLPGGAMRYQLTALGKQQYIDRETRQPVSPDGPEHETADFCMARLSLDQIKRVELHETPNAPTHAVITYTYNVQTPDWTRDPAARRAFPAVDRVVSGAHTATLQEELTSTPEGWVANELVPPAGSSDKGAIATRTTTQP